MSDGAPAAPSPAALTTLIQLVFREYSRRGYSLGLNPAQWAALRFFAHAEKQRCTASEFARFHRTTRGTAGHTVAALVRKAYLYRSRSVEDRRVTYLRVTEEGRALLKRDPIAPIIEAVTGKCTIVGVFEVFNLRSMPGRTSSFTVFLQLTDGIGRYDLVIEIYDLQQGVVLGRGSGLGLNWPQKLLKMNVTIPVPPVPVTHEGAYDLVVTANGQEIERQKFTVAVFQEDGA